MDRILRGPDFFKPIPLTSLGIRILKKLQEKNDDVLYIDAVTDEKLTNKEFLDLSCKLAKSFQNCGLNKNDVLVISGENSIYYNIPVVAGLFLGMISGFINHNYTKNEFLHALDIYQPKIIFVSAKLLNTFNGIEKIIQDLKIIILDDIDVPGYDNLKTFIKKNCDTNDLFKPVEVDTFQQVAFLLSSSGTTGMPKAVMITHDNIAMRINQLEDPRFSLAKEETISSVLPNFHTFGLVLNIVGIIKGNRLIVIKRFNEEIYMKSIEKFRITNLTIVPTIAHSLVKSKIFKNYDISSVEEVFCGGSLLNVRIEKEFVKLFPKLKIFRKAYGLTESTLSVTAMPTNEKKLGSSGKVVPGMSLCVCDEFGNRLESNQLGEIYLKGRMVAKGYYRNEEATKNTIINNWLHTGDYGYYDEEGYVFIVSRAKDLIKYKGFQVAPAEIEDILISHPKVKEVCVVGKPDEFAGELPTGFVVKQPNVIVTEEELVQFVAERISKTKHLRGGIHFLEEFPMTSTGKIKRNRLKELLMPQIK